MAYITKKTTQDGVKPIGSNLFGTCLTSSNTATKVVTLDDFDVLVQGVTIHVMFRFANAVESGVQLKVGSTEPRPVFCNGETGKGKWEEGAVISFTYTGALWAMNDTQTLDPVTYQLTKDGNTITLTGSNGDASSVVDADTDTDTTYTLSKSGDTITLVGSDGSRSSVTDEDTKTMPFWYLNTVSPASGQFAPVPITAITTPINVPIPGITSQQGEAFTLLSDGTLRCDKAGIYLVSLRFTFNPCTSGDLMGIGLRSSGNGSVGIEYQRVGGNYDSVMIPMRPASYGEGDILQPYIQNNTSARGSCYSMQICLYCIHSL